MESRFHQLNGLIAQSFINQDFEQTQQLINENLELAELQQKDFHYGNAIHVSNIYLGLIELEKGNILDAKDYLMKSIPSKSSPQLKSFGPNMLLAEALLKEGQSKIVLQYLNLLENIWIWYFRILPIRNWKKTIRRGDVPNFKAHLFYHVT